MKRGQALLMVAAAAGLIYVLTHKGGATDGSGGMTGSTGTNFPGEAQALSDSTKTSTENAGYSSAVTKFLNTPVNTTESVKAGIDVINTGFGSLPRTSQTLAQGVTALVNGKQMTGNIASLPTGVAFVATQQPTRNSAGQTATDIQIAKNYAASGAENKSFKSYWA
jgi:hypothetical protein